MIMRQASRPDAEAIHGLRVAAEQWLAGRGIQQWDMGEVSLADVRSQIGRGEWPVCRSGDIVCAGLRLLWSDSLVWQAADDATVAAYVHGLVIDRQHAGTGLGASLLAWAGHRGRNAGAIVLRLDCVQANAGLRRYYARLGFREVGTRDFHGRLSVVLLEKDLA